MKEIEKIVERYAATDWKTEQSALATVVRVEESAYRRVGARMYVSSTGQWIGGISGGCLEGDALRRAKIAIMKDRSSMVVYDTMEEDTHQIGVGLGCNGRIEVLFTPIDSTDSNNPVELLKQIKGTRTEAVLLQLIETPDSDLLGWTVLEKDVDQMTKRLKLESDVLSLVIQLVKEKKKSKVFTTDNQEQILVEQIRPNTRVVLVGDNYDVNAFVGIAEALGWEIHVAGKQRKLDHLIFEKAARVYTYKTVADISVDAYTAIILMSHDYRTDYKLLKKYGTLNVPYIGLLGPKKRMQKMQMELEKEGIELNLATMENLYAPVGLDIGAESPEEIALAITAEIVSVFRKRDGGKLRERKGPIHER